MSADDLNVTVLAVSAALLAGVVAVRIATRSGLPGLLLYLGIGLAIGESGLGIGFEDVELAMVLGSLALAVILAEGGFTTQWSVTRPVAAMSIVLATVGVGVSVAVTGGLTYLILDVDLRTALLLGAVVSSTDAAAVFSVMRQLPITRRLRATLEAESGFNDPPVIILVTVIASDAWDSSGPLAIGALMLQQLVVGLLVGLAVAWVGQWVLGRSALPAAGLYPLATIAILFVAFSLAGMAGGSPFLAVYVAGMWLGNTTLPHRSATAGFAEGLAWVAQIGLFIMLGLLASPGRLLDALLPALLVGSVLLLVARPLSVLVCATPYRVPWREQAFMSWAGLRGAVPIVLATIPITQGLPSAHQIFDVVFLLVVVFTLVQGPTLPWVAKKLGVTDEERTTDVTIESAPLEDIDVTVLQLTVSADSRLAGVYVDELRLPGDAVITLIRRRGEIFAPKESTVLRAGDHLLLATSNEVRSAAERRLRAVSRGGRLAGWTALRAR
ncbi:potassium/proton antiporter [Aeromicrobium chenweiae]|uniref:Potassium/proton antiporter n=1 Tax=Aeromicrobium chenweiae TaxID=2079793 RepID=A0A2S0WNG7_9ACTN|nr:potassium/proton antiporter [Aeromicrobium chenweiae]AWB92889.1 potassium/proton antiporter [Aeromicrobium chenweiae]TGN33884.1 potassium/proton antiporter [Aeromicrobium chenweiae]